MTADVIDTVPPPAIVDEKFSDPLETPASHSMMTVDATPLAAVLNRAYPGVPAARAVSGVMVENVSTPAAEPGYAVGFDRGRLASLVPVSALNVPVVLPGGEPVKISTNAAVPRAEVKLSILVFRTVSLYESVIHLFRCLSSSQSGSASVEMWALKQSRLTCEKHRNGSPY